MVVMKDHEFYMAKVLELAKSGWGRTNPNPLVGAILVKNNIIISCGYHQAYGFPHAEVNAIMNNKEKLDDSILYVNLEPCSHFGKTPPCAKAIIETGIKNVVIAMIDPNPKVQGNGVKMLKEAGINVILGVLEKEARKLNEIFITYITKNKPFVIMKSAMTLDGKIASVAGDSKWITGTGSRNYVHELRDRVSAIMVGIQTIIMDNPSLTTRLPHKEGKDPIRIIVDSKGRLPLDSQVLNKDNNVRVILATTSQIESKKEQQLLEKGVTIIKADQVDGKVDLKQVIKKLYELGIDSVLIEGGGMLNASALTAGIVDKVILFIAPKIIGGKSAPTPVEGEGVNFISECLRLHDITIDRIEDDLVYEGYL
jgi:diaminohydroxyphosphoribosylaminopyrimidine deaminase/5-amino-6-(5-phosphoribosylamino)uracil reductase